MSAMPADVIALVGSLRRGSHTRRLVEAMARLAPNSMSIEILDIGDLPFYNPDAEVEPPKSWLDFRLRVWRSDAALFATPEYNRSIPAVLKNAIDVGSRPRQGNVWAGKPAAVVSVSRSSLGGFGAHHHLRQALVALDMPALPQPEAYVAHADRLFDAAGKFVDGDERLCCTRFLEAFSEWIERHRRSFI